jgi:hypothetical protein
MCVGSTSPLKSSIEKAHGELDTKFTPSGSFQRPDRDRAQRHRTARRPRYHLSLNPAGLGFRMDDQDLVDWLCRAALGSDHG